MRRIITISFLVGVLFFLISCQQKDLKIKKITLADQILKVEIANDYQSRVRGLSGRKSLDLNQGMLFQFPEPGKYQFWMKEMNFSLDIIYLYQGQVEEIFSAVPVQTEGEITRVNPKKNADQVLELNAGWADLHDLEIGDKIYINDTNYTNDTN